MEAQDRRQLQNSITSLILDTVPPEDVQVFMEELQQVVNVYARERNLLAMFLSTTGDFY
jgi:hypothetical protein